eukprot:Rmarinus@m.12204
MKHWAFPSSIGRQLTLVGRSRSAQATVFAIPEMNWYLDAGAFISNCHRPDHVFISHTHSDHCFLLTHLVSRSKPPTVHVPSKSVPFLEAYMKASQELNDSGPFPENVVWETNYVTHAVEPDAEFEVSHAHGTGHKQGSSSIFKVKTIKTDHSVPSVGYCFYDVRKKLKDEYVGLHGKDIARLKKQGIEVSHDVEFPMFAFLGDTTASVFETYPWLLKFPVIITECTFLFDNDLEEARQRHHTHWTDIETMIRENPRTTFVLTHFSLRYDHDDIHNFFEDIDLGNIVPFLYEGSEEKHYHSDDEGVYVVSDEDNTKKHKK